MVDTTHRTRRPTPFPRSGAPGLLATLVLTLTAILLLPAGRVHAQTTVTITGDRLSGTVLPILPLTGDVTMTARRGWAWTVDDTKRLLLEGDVVVSIAGQPFTGPTCAVWLNRLPTADGLVNQVALYFDRVVNPRRASGFGVGGDSLLITGSAQGEVTLSVDLLQEGRPAYSEVLRAGERRLQMHRRLLEGDPPLLAQRPQVDEPEPPHVFDPQPGGLVEERDFALPATMELPPLGQRKPWLREPGSILRLTYGAIHVQPGATENVISISDSIIIEYFSESRTDDLAQLTLSADRAVIFTDPGTLEEMTQWNLDVSIVRGIYLEGNVTASANEGEYLARAPRIYYDFTTDQAILLDAVLRTYERDGRLPVFVRAEEIRQIALTQWKTKQVHVTTSEFFTGHLAVGAKRMTVTRRPVGGGTGRGTGGGPGSSPGSSGGGSLSGTIGGIGSGGQEGPQETHLDAESITLEAGGAPFFYWPRFRGTIHDIPLRGLSIGVSDNDGVRIETRWNFLSLLDFERPPGVDATLKLDGFTKRGPAAGLDVTYTRDSGTGRLDLYGIYDDGTDLTSSGVDVQHDEEMRGVALWEHQMDLGRNWSLQAQGSYISDPSFISTWRERDFVNRREYETGFSLKHQRDNTAITLTTQYDVNDFISNDYLLASAAYTVDRTPEGSWRTYGRPWFNENMTYSGEMRTGRVRLVFEESAPFQLGVPPAAFGVGPTTPISSALLAQGLRSKWVYRFDSRHELAWPMKYGALQVTPFVVGRMTAYDDDFTEFSGKDDKARAFGAAGLRLNTQFQRVDNSVESQLFDLHRLRHIIEPSLTVWVGASDVDQSDLPVYDLGVESLATGGVVRLGLRNTWQTQRGGPGRWRSVDVLTLNTDVVFHSNDTNKESPTPQFFDYRPEYSQMGDHVATSGVLRLSDTFIVSGEGTIDIDESAIARGAIGAELQHSPLLSTFVEYRYIDASDHQLLGVGWNYQISKKYKVAFWPQWDFDADEFRYVTLNVVRSFPDFDMSFLVSHDEIRDDTTFGASLKLAEF
ncbi:MAG: LPS assembly protein LptD [Planctomycetes bacterium]|nr:LPS assembly protein LptD [Planctomycetota bacterium]